ncbi:MAG TPA: hypothetical protein DCL72_02220 [Rhizobiales bacterium]|nr:hypothetical protein [Hyphomicrobiales bacterium]
MGRLNRQYSEVWPNITMEKPAPPDAVPVSEPDKFAKYFSPNPGEGLGRPGGGRSLLYILAGTFSASAAAWPLCGHGMWLAQFA